MMSDESRRPSRRRPRSLAVVSLCCLALATPATPFSLRPTSSAKASLTRQLPLRSNRGRSTSAITRLDMSATPPPMPRSHLSVSLDQPLISDTLFTAANSKPSALRLSGLASALKGAVQSPVLRVALATFLLAMAVSLLMKHAGPVFSRIATTGKKMLGRVQRLLEGLNKKEPEGVPMPFDNSEEGWGVCTLANKQRLGKTSFLEYTFHLPAADYVLPLEMGQTVRMCCLDQKEQVVTGEFFPFEKTSPAKPGQFRILVPDRSNSWNEYALGPDTHAFSSALAKDVAPGDEVALQPGSMRLAYRGQYLPVTDMVYIACSTGIVPVLEQLRGVLASESSSVKGVTVVWINDETSDFDITAELLEKEYFKYSSQLDVTCVVEDMRIRNMEDNIEVRQAVPNFHQGTMAVIAGPQDFTRKTVSYLESRGYPRDTICVL